MNFLAPWMLFGVAAVGLPLAIHLIQRSRPTVVPWAAMEFLLRSIKQTQAASRLRDLILLLCRMGVIALAALAIARPSASFLQLSGPVDAVILLDVSQSMKTVEGLGSPTRTRWDIAREKAAELLSRMPTGSRVRLLPFADRPLSSLVDSGSKDPLAARDALTALRPTDLGTRLEPALEEAWALLRTGTLPDKQLHLLSDAGESTWRACGPLIASLAGGQKTTTPIHWVRIGTPVKAQAQILDCVPLGGMVLSGRRQSWMVRIRNSGTQTLKGMTLTLTPSRTAGGGKPTDPAESVAIDELGPGEERIVHPEILLDQPGWQQVEAVATHPGLRLEAAARMSRIVQVRESFKALLVEEVSQADSTRGNSLFLATALRSLAGESPTHAASHWDKSEKVWVETRASATVGPGLLMGMDLVVLCGVDPMKLDPGFLRDLAEWCGQGKVVYWMAPVNGAPLFPSDSSFLGAWPRVLDRPIPAAAEMRVDPATASGWLAPFSRPPLDRLGRARWSRFQPIGPPTPAQSARTDQLAPPREPETLLRTSDGKPVLIATTYRQGQIVLSNLAFDTSDGDFPLGPIFVPWVGSLVSHAETWQAAPRNLGVGQTVQPWIGTDKATEGNKAWQLKGPGDLAVEWTPSESSQALLDAGVWQAEDAGVPLPGAIWAVGTDGSETTDLDPASAAFAVESSGGLLKVTDLGEPSTALGLFGLEGGEMTLWLLWLGLLLLLLEGFVALWAGKPL